MKRSILGFGHKMIKLLVGLFIAAIGITMMIRADIGLPPWDVLHMGVSQVVNISMGQAIIVVSILLTILGALLGEKVGIGTICNMFLVGTFIDLITNSQLIPKGQNFFMGFIMLNLGMMIFAIGTVIYMSCELGCGSKDGVTMGINKRINKPVKYVRAGLEILAIMIGMFMGAKFNIMTIYSALVFGFLMQFSFKVLKCNAAALNHRSLKDMVIKS